MIIVMIFFSVTSSYAGEVIATSTLVSYDIYKRYINPTATPPQVVKVAKYSVFGWAIFSSCLASIFMALQKYPWAGYSIFLGVLQHQVSFNSLGFTWKDLNQAGAVGGSVGMVLAFIVWLITCKTYTGSITVDNLSNQWVSFAGNVTALVAEVISIVLSLIWPANFGL